MEPAVFLDRDGVLIQDSAAYITHSSQVQLLPGVVHAVRRLNEASIPVVVCTNQGAVARGLITEADLREIHATLEGLLAASGGAKLDRIYYCPFHPDGTVEKYRKTSYWRKPSPGMLETAARE